MRCWKFVGSWQPGGCLGWEVPSEDCLSPPPHQPLPLRPRALQSRKWKAWRRASTSSPNLRCLTERCPSHWFGAWCPSWGYTCVLVQIPPQSVFLVTIYFSENRCIFFLIFFFLTQAVIIRLVWMWVVACRWNLLAWFCAIRRECWSCCQCAVWQRVPSSGLCSWDSPEGGCTSGARSSKMLQGSNRKRGLQI